MEGTLLIADASTLLNFLRVGRFDLVKELGYRVRVVDAVYEEVRCERVILDKLVGDGHIRTITLEGKILTEVVAGFLSLGLGTGEAFSFAAALEFEAALAIDDLRAVKRSKPVAGGLTILTSSDIVLVGIHANRLTVAEADHIKADWGDNHRFRLKFESFGDLL